MPTQPVPQCHATLSLWTGKGILTFASFACQS
jgi:hypothetical protein